MSIEIIKILKAFHGIQLKKNLITIIVIIFKKVGTTIEPDGLKKTLYIVLFLWIPKRGMHSKDMQH